MDNSKSVELPAEIAIVGIGFILAGSIIGWIILSGFCDKTNVLIDLAPCVGSVLVGILILRWYWCQRRKSYFNRRMSKIEQLNYTDDVASLCTSD